MHNWRSTVVLPQGHYLQVSVEEQMLHLHLHLHLHVPFVSLLNSRVAVPLTNSRAWLVRLLKPAASILMQTRADHSHASRSLGS